MSEHANHVTLLPIADWFDDADLSDGFAFSDLRDRLIRGKDQISGRPCELRPDGMLADFGGRREISPLEVTDLQFRFAGRGEIVLLDPRTNKAWVDLRLHNYTAGLTDDGDHEIDPHQLARERRLRLEAEARAELRAHGLTDDKIDGDHEPVYRLAAAKMRDPQITAGQVLAEIAAKKAAKARKAIAAKEVANARTAASDAKAERPERQRGRPRETRDAIAEKMRNAIVTEKVTRKELRIMKQEELPRQFGGSRGTAVKARDKVLSEMPPIIPDIY